MTLVELPVCTCAEVEGENPDCAKHGVSVAIWAKWTDFECDTNPDIDSHTVRRKCQETAAEIERLTADCRYLLSCIDMCNEAGAPPDELDSEDVALIEQVRQSLSLQDKS